MLYRLEFIIKVKCGYVNKKFKNNIVYIDKNKDIRLK